VQGFDWLSQLACDREEEDGSEDDDKVSGDEEGSPSYEENGSLGHPVQKQRCQTLQSCQHMYMNCSSADSLTSE